MPSAERSGPPLGPWGRGRGEGGAESMVERDKVVVCDNGTGFVKCGFAGDNFPRATFPCMVGTPTLRTDQDLGGEAVKDLVVGAECAELRHQLDVTYPVSNGIINSWEDMYHIWDHTFYDQLQVDPTECRILLTDPPLNPAKNRERMMETMFEKYGFGSAFVQVQAVLALYSQGLLTGVVVDAGDGVTHAIPIVNGYCFPNATKRLNVAGRHCTAHLLDLLQRRGYALNKDADFDTVRRIKEKLCYSAYEYDRELQLARETTHLMKSYTMPDGQVLRLGPERFQAPEVMFRPHLVDVEGAGVAEMAFNCIQDMAMDNRRDLYQSIVLSGGSTMYPGLPSRMHNEIKSLYLDRILKGNREGLKKFKLNVEDPPRRRHMVFQGGAVLADIMKDNDEWWVSKAEWEEQGARVLSKCGGLGV